MPASRSQTPHNRRSCARTTPCHRRRYSFRRSSSLAAVAATLKRMSKAENSTSSPSARLRSSRKLARWRASNPRSHVAGMTTGAVGAGSPANSPRSSSIVTFVEPRSLDTDEPRRTGKIPAMASPKRRAPPRRAGATAARKVENRKTQFQGWRTTDEDEVERRRLRAEAERPAVRCLEMTYRPFATFAVGSGTASADKDREYRVEIRSLSERLNSCSCTDHRVNGLGTCKHVEAVLRKLTGKGGRAAAGAGDGPRRVEIFLDRAASTPLVRMLRPAGRPSAKLEAILAPFFGADGTLLAPPEAAVPSLARLLAAAPRRGQRARALVGGAPPLGRGGGPAGGPAHRPRALSGRRRGGQAEPRPAAPSALPLSAGRGPPPRLRRARPAGRRDGARQDRPGHRRLRAAAAHCAGIERVLVVCPASLKAEWEEQIAKFTDLPALIVMGSRAVAAAAVPGALLLLSHQLRAGGRRRSTTSSACWRPTWSSSTRPSGSRTGSTKTAQAVKRLREPLRLRAHRHAAGKPHRRALLHRPVPGPRASSAPSSASTATSTSSTSRGGRSATRTWTSCTGVCGRCCCGGARTRWRTSSPAAPSTPTSCPCTRSRRRATTSTRSGSPGSPPSPSAGR